MTGGRVKVYSGNGQGEKHAICRETENGLIAALIIIFFGLPNAAAETKLLRYPDIYKNKIVFCYAGDLYTASVTGKNVKRLTDFPGEELLPKFSPDGEQIAFTAEFAGNKDVYVMPVLWRQGETADLSSGGGICR